jgi:hypothetical protein
VNRLLGSERGTAIVTAIGVMTMMFAAGLATYTIMDGQERQAGRERVGESSFNLTEAALNNQAFILSRRWPGRGAVPYPSCSSSSAPASYCPQPAQLAASYDTPDYASGTTWATRVRDDTGSNFYKQDSVDARPAWDANNNNRVWVRSESTVRGRTRALVALVRIQPRPEEFPRRTIIAGKFRTDNAGNKTIVQTNSTATSPHPVTLRCSPSAGTACADYDNSKARPQIEPREGSVVGPEFVGEPTIPEDVVERLREVAEANGTYYPTGCPPTPEGTPPTVDGAVVFAENCNASFQSNGVWNSSTNPGIIIFRRGSIEFNANLTYYGLIYMVNADNSNNYLVKLRGGATINGGIFVDGNAGVDVGSDKVNLVYDPNAFNQVRSYGSAGIVQNSWREVRP